VKEKLTTFIKMFYSNKTLLRARKASFFTAFLLLVVNAMLVTVPTVAGLVQGLERGEEFDDIHAAFREAYVDRLDCRIADRELTCDDLQKTTYGAYAFIHVEDVPETLEDIEESSVILGRRHAVIIHVDETDGSQRILQGSYTLHGDLDFSRVQEGAVEADDERVYQDTVTDFFLDNLYYANIAEGMLFLYPAQFFQTALYVLLVSPFFLITNFRAPVRKIDYATALKITIFAMTGPALLAAVLGWPLAGWASLMFTIVYLLRIIAVYYRVNNLEEPLI